MARDRVHPGLMYAASVQVRPRLRRYPRNIRQLGDVRRRDNPVEGSPPRYAPAIRVNADRACERRQRIGEGGAVAARILLPAVAAASSPATASSTTTTTSVTAAETC